MSATISRLPSSIEGIKRRAKSIKRERGLSHMQALDVAAREVHYENFQHAKNALSASAGAAAPARSHLVYVTSHWRDPESPAEGRETMSWRLSRPLSVLAPNGLYGFRSDAQDHLEERGDRESAESARESVLRIIRSLQFADAACVRPWSGSSIREFEWARNLPRKDHISNWVHLESGALLFADEPYCTAILRAMERREWSHHEEGDRVVVAAPAWPGMYLPGRSELLLAMQKEDEVVLDRMVEALARAPAPAVTWAGDSAPYYPTFTSPARAASGVLKRARPRRLPEGTIRRGARLVGSLPDRRWWRPNASMSLADHTAAAQALQEAAAWAGHALSAAFRTHIREIRSTLDLWLSEEHRGRGGSSADIYYGPMRVGVVEEAPDLKSLRTLVAAHYPACTPRERLLKHIDAAAAYARPVEH